MEPSGERKVLEQASGGRETRGQRKSNWQMESSRERKELGQGGGGLRMIHGQMEVNGERKELGQGGGGMDLIHGQMEVNEERKELGQGGGGMEARGQRKMHGQSVGGMGTSGQMDLDDQIDFPDLGKSVETTKTDDVMCEDDHRSGMEETRGKAPMEPLNQACVQQGSGGAHATPGRNGLQGWAKVVAGSQEKELEDCPEVTVDRSGEEPTVVFPTEAYQKMEDMYRFIAVAGFYGGRSTTGMDYRYVFQTLRNLWVNVCCPNFSVIGNGRFLVRVSSEEELNEVIRKRWAVGGRFLITSRWKPGSELRLHEEESIPLWIRLPQLPILFWNIYSFKAIAQGLGAAFVRADECTMHRDKLGFARLCIEVSLNFQPVPKIKLEVRESKIIQEVLYESKIRFCRVCGTTSHYEDLFKNRGTVEKPIAEEQVWKKVLMIKKDRGSLHRSDSGGREPQSNRFAAFSNQLHQDEGTGIQLDRTLGVNPTCNVGDGGESSCQQKEAKKVGAKVSNTSTKRGAKGGKNSIDGKGEERKVDSIENRITNPFFSIKKQADSSASPSRFRFTTRSKDDPSVKESPCILINKEGSEQASDIEGRRGETPQNRQGWTRKSTRYASKGKKGRPPITLLNLEDALLQSCNGSKKRKKVAETMHPSIMKLPQDGGNERNEKDMVLETENTVSEVPLKEVDDKLNRVRMWRGDVRGCPMMRLLVKLNRVRMTVLDWNTNSFGNLAENIANLQSRLKVYRDRVEQGTEGALDDEHTARQQLSHALLMEEILEVCTDYFKKVLATDEAQGNMFEGLDNTVTVTDADNVQLLQPISEEEVTTIVWSLDKDSAAGPDGFPNYFFQECWEMVRTEVVHVVQNFFSYGQLVRSVNETMICLIPKKDNSKKVEDFRPISLCNTTYKIIVKVIVNRMRGILSRIINVNQAAFSKGRHIHDNINWVNEIINSKDFWDKGGCCLNLDLMKAYDRVSWVFLANSMSFLRFHPRWIARVMKCVTSMSYAVLVNGRMGEKFDGRRGLRQGDPLSPYLFLIVMEMFNRRLNQETISNNILVPKIRRVTPNGCAMFFADDVIMAVKATKKTMTTIKVILQDFDCLTGMKVNMQKSMIFARTMVDCHMGDIQSILPWSSGSLPSDYLRLPLSWAISQKIYVCHSLLRWRRGWLDGRHRCCPTRAGFASSVMC
ncbi:retrotransposable element ORF2 protein [Nymphaea thermarum]|nr:retrotransposable element ORF2 protein [Nymphaea thermarum]